MNKPPRNPLDPGYSRDKGDAFSLFEEELRLGFPSREEILREAKEQTLARKKARRRAIKLGLLLVVTSILAIDPAWKVDTLTTVVGEQRQHRLIDGSTVALNTNTVLKVEQRLRSRQLVLKQGEAAFTVSHGWRPFIVTADDTTVMDIGTAFSVRLKAQDVRVAVSQGAVNVAVGQQQQTLAAGQAITSSQGRLGVLQDIDVDQETAWQQGKWMFDGTPLINVAEEIQRYRGQSVQVSEQASSIRVSGIYDIQGVEAFIDDLPQIIPVQVERADDGAVLIKKR
ncbi:FecR domain-containing protein [Methylobacillus arboreus]|uniref:FecR family protein n=1 Tax=Methylobacillus arboreus TaxID=755170 RepID=UPI001E46D4E8|nr:FecR domain-containing protein [Methylobacillus arboreus]MCB5190987.1 FecR domain-containing protein [Methylobacillus arboreus]